MLLEATQNVTVIEVEEGVILVSHEGAIGRQGVPGITGPAGPAGGTGPQGPPGASGNAASVYVHTQGVAASTWVINHMLGARPVSIVIEDSAHTEVHGGVSHPTLDQSVITFIASFSGIATVRA